MHAKNRGAVIALWTATVVAAFGIGWITPPPHTSPQEPPLDDFAAEIHAALAEPDVIARQQRTASLLERLDADDLPEVTAVYERMSPVIEVRELGLLFAAWAHFDPKGAIDYALAWPWREMKEQQNVAVQSAIEVWAQSDPIAAHQSALEIAGDRPRLRPALWRGLVTGWAHASRGKEGLGDFIANLPPLRRRTEAAESAAKELVREGGADAALAWAEAILRNENYDEVFKRSVFVAATEAAAQWDAQRTAAWVVEHAGEKYAEEGPGIVAKHWGREDGAAAIAWLGEQPGGELRDKAIRQAFVQWSRQDPLQAREWLDSGAPPMLLDPALEVKAERVGPHDPEVALGWCEKIRDAARRQGCIESTAQKWYAQDAVAAEAWLQQSALDEDARARVRKVGPPAKKKRPGGRRPPAAGGAR